jgi:hypothetical protein
MLERYSIEVGEGCVIIYGTLTIEEAFDYLNFFDKKGYNSVGPGYQNSALVIYKEDEKESEFTPGRDTK